MKKICISLFLCTAALLAAAQEKPQPIAKKDLPESAVCAVCSTLGTMMTPAKPMAGVMYRGKAYYFHGKEMLDMFLKDPEAYSPPVLPRAASAFDLKDVAGARFNADTFTGHVVLVDFWATWCVPCRTMMPVLDGIYEKHHSEGLEMLSVSTDEDKKSFDKFVKNKLFPNPVMFDNRKTYAAWHVTAIPALFLVKDGQIVAQWTGIADGAAIEAEVAKALDK